MASVDRRPLSVDKKTTMKKILFAIASVMTLALTSCFENTGYNSTYYFSRVVTVTPTSNSVKFVADYTGEEFKGFTNLKTEEQLAQFGLADAKRAELYIRLDVDNENKQEITLEQAQKVDIQSVSNTTPTDSIRPFASWMQKPLFNDYAPIVWVADGYLNVVPVIPSDEEGKYFLTAEKAINDTLYLRLGASYTPNKNKQNSVDKLQCFDLRTLNDTADADLEQRAKMIEVLEAIKQHKSDSMRIVLTGKFEWTKINGKDTIGDMKAITDYFKCEFIR